MNRRNYRNNIDFIEAGFRACWVGAQDMLKAAKVLLDSSYHAPAMSLSVLTLEELGKLFCLDGLLFARSDDHKAEAFAKSLKSHDTKLLAVELFPLLLANIASADPRYQSEKRFRQAIAVGIKDLRERGKTVRLLLGSDTFLGLNDWKQSGFYSQPKGNTFVTPSAAVSHEVAQAVYMLAWRASTGLDFLLKDGNLERYMSFARVLRSKLSEADHEALSEMGKSICDALFPSEERENQDVSVH